VSGVKNRMEELSKEGAAELMRFWHGQAINEQKKELSEYKKKAKAQAQIQIEPVPLTIELIKQDQGQEDRLEPIEA